MTIPWTEFPLSDYALAPGIYLPQLPGFRKLDLRVEGVNTNLPGLQDQGYFYANAHYPQGYTNYGQIFGSWVGRQGAGEAATSTYWFSARNKATVSYRKMSADPSFLRRWKPGRFFGEHHMDGPATNRALRELPVRKLEVSITGNWDTIRRVHILWSPPVSEGAIRK